MNWRRIGISLQWVVGVCMAVVAVAGAFSHAETVGLVMLMGAGFLAIYAVLLALAWVVGFRCIPLIVRWCEWVTNPDHTPNEKG